MDWWKILNLLFDKLLIPVILVAIGFLINKKLEKAKLENSKILTDYARQQNELLEDVKRENSQTLTDYAREQNEILERAKLENSKDLAIFTKSQNLLIEKFKNELINELEYQKNWRAAFAEVVRKIATGSHYICWLTWKAKYTPDIFREEDIINYEKEVHILLSELVASRVLLACLDSELHIKMNDFIDRLYELDVRVGEVKAVFFKDQPQGKEEFSKLHSESIDLENSLLEKVKEISLLRTGAISIPNQTNN